MVKVTKFVSSRPLVSLILLVVFGTIPIVIWCIATKNIRNNVDLLTEDLRSSLVSEIEIIGKFIYPKTNSSTISLARVIDSSITNNNTPFTEIQTQIAPVLFQAYSTFPQVSQVSYISTDGLLFSYITGLNTSFTVFANSSGGDYSWYTQTIDQRTGLLIGDATRSQPLNVTNTDWFHAAERDHTTAFVGTGLGGDDNEKLFQRVVSLDSKKGVVSLGFPVKYLTDALNRLDLHGGEICMWTKDGTVLVLESSQNASSFTPRDCSSGGVKEIKGSKFEAYCSVLEVSGVPLTYTLMSPNKGIGTSISHAAMYMLIFMAFYAIFWPLGFVVFMARAARREMDIRSTLINQMEATQQAERKSMNKSQAFAQASHDIRGSLAGITGLIDLCRQEVKPGSDVDASLQQMNVCTKDLVGLLNSVLDMSKIESGKMQLEEEEFNLAKLLEDVVDFFHPTAMKKKVDVVLDLHDGSILKSSNVRGDSGKLKQILNNLVSNAVKFTVEGHISIRAWAQKPGPKSSVVLASEPKGSTVSMFSKLMLCMNKDQSSSSSSSTYEKEISNSIRNNANTMEFVFEVDDTGKGIPVEMRKSVFENYVQVRETARGQQGTGLGLGIVQSLVRLMGGEISITDKAMGEKGTCFQFNVLLITSETPPVSDVEAGGGDYITTPNVGLTINTSSLVGGGGSMNIRQHLSPRFNNCLSSSPKQEASRVVLLIKDEERRRVTEKSIKILGIKVTVVEKWEHLSQALERLFGFSPQSSMESSLRNELSSTSSRELPLIGMDGVDSRSQIPRRRSASFSAFVLLMIDANAGPFPEMDDIVEQFRRGLHHGVVCKVVWLNEPNGRGSERGDICCLKPLHGSRLNRMLKMLPELGGIVPKQELQRESLLRHTLVAAAATSPKGTTSCEIQEESSSRYNKKLGKSVRTVPKPVGNSGDEQGMSNASYDALLKGKRVMVVDDNRITSSVATRKLKKMGVSDVRQCDNGKEAVRLVSEWLTQQGSVVDVLPFDYIFMDCQMPEMDGYETTREIRKVERKYGVHIPIIAVSGHDPGSREAKEAIQAGMDAFLEKDMNQNQLGKIIREIDSKRTVHATAE
ncbi:Histidine kinase CKI1 [Raphanus sativus]|uniref:histidine kinase n=1 Tax=Raphanus sativus TaxID=3726 RepID=A0A6J0JNT1_RAPSA|nr:histidine kinase CKI1 [Raphanus sativus]KAJ4892523.1 Histidine kinase CKI1 [Raphanus sativus]